MVAVKWKRTILHLIFWTVEVSCFTGSAQENIKDDLLSIVSWPRFAEIETFYQRNGYQRAWAGHPALRQELVDLIEAADLFALNRPDYPDFKSSGAKNVGSQNDVVSEEFLYTDAAIHFFSDIQIGNAAPIFRYDGLGYAPIPDVAARLPGQLRPGGLKEFAVLLQPRSPEYSTMIQVLHRFLRSQNSKDFKDVKVTGTRVDTTHPELLLRLAQLGILDTLQDKKDNQLVLRKVKEAQRRFDLLNDGVLRSTTLQAFNVPIAVRIRELKTALNTLRWLHDLKRNESVLVINLPSAYLMLYDKGKVIMDSRIIVGKGSTPTPVLASRIKEVILYPYWNVPHSIATRELLPSIKRNIGYLAAHNYQILNKEGRILNPYSINWKALSPAYFPYVIRQSTGCDNALGIIKFNFYNPFTVYLHDTPSKGLFSLNKRYFSHGCMRLENYRDLAHYLLGSNRIAFDTLTVKGCLLQQAPKTVPVEQALPVVVLYQTAWYDKAGTVRFYEDVYRRIR